MLLLEGKTYLLSHYVILSYLKLRSLRAGYEFKIWFLEKSHFVPPLETDI